MVNFHVGQRQALLNVIYLHEVLGEQCVADAYRKLAPDLLDVIDPALQSKARYQFPKYAVKMATGTGKTWVMHALVIWQMLNARHEATPGGRFTQCFLIVAPGVIVYERLLDAFVGRQATATGLRDPATNDFHRNADLLLPPAYRDEVLAFVGANVVQKQDIGSKVTGDGLIALTNWHVFMERDRAIDIDDDSPQAIVGDLLPLQPGTTQGNDLNEIDHRRQSRRTMDCLKAQPDLMVINDEAHHIHALEGGDEGNVVEWQAALDRMCEGKQHFMQVDFSATPYNTRTMSRRQVKCYFPHVVVDFNLPAAQRAGLVKLLTLDKRQELTELAGLDYRSVRNGRRIVGLSDGQRLMLRAGLTHLRLLERDFARLAKNRETKCPKMLVACEETNLSPFVERFLMDEGLEEDDIVTVDSNRQNEVTPEAWKALKVKLFDIDNRERPKVIISVMMLREGFDVNNICVLVALRAAGSKILVEQLVGRGLRLMWREPEFTEMRMQNIETIIDRHQEPSNYIDTLSIVEHPAFLKYYDEVRDGEPTVAEDHGRPGRQSTGDMMLVGLRPGYEALDLTWPIVVNDSREVIEEVKIDPTHFLPYTGYTLEQLHHDLATGGEKFVSQEVNSRIQVATYEVSGDLFTAQNYNEYLLKLQHNVLVRVTNHRRNLPLLQVDRVAVVEAIDWYVRNRLFDRPFDPFADNNWKILLSHQASVTEHIKRELNIALQRVLRATTIEPAQVRLVPFSSVPQLRMRQSCSVQVVKCIYPRLTVATQGGGLERAFIAFLEHDGSVQSYMKINEYYHRFDSIQYFRDNGFPASYFPDFLVKTRTHLYLVETKADTQVSAVDVQHKKVAAAEWVERINGLQAEKRMDCEWEYLIVPQTQFERLSAGGATMDDLARVLRKNAATARGELF